MNKYTVYLQHAPSIVDLQRYTSALISDLKHSRLLSKNVSLKHIIKKGRSLQSYLIKPNKDSSLSDL